MSWMQQPSANRHGSLRLPISHACAPVTHISTVDCAPRGFPPTLKNIYSLAISEISTAGGFFCLIAHDYYVDRVRCLLIPLYFNNMIKNLFSKKVLERCTNTYVIGWRGCMHLLVKVFPSLIGQLMNRQDIPFVGCLFIQLSDTFFLFTQIDLLSNKCSQSFGNS